jgi:hypothetical protein
MVDDSQSSWTKRFGVTIRPETPDSVLQTLRAGWVEGSVTDQSLALELWRIWSDERLVAAVSRGSDQADSVRVNREVAILAEAMLASAEVGDSTAAERREFLEAARAAAESPSIQL